MSDNQAAQDNNPRPPRTNEKRKGGFRRAALLVLAILLAAIVVMALIPTTRWVDAIGKSYVITDYEAEVRPSVEGAILRWEARSNDTVKKGQLLIQLNDSLQQAFLQQAKNDQTSAEAQLNHVLSKQELEKSQIKEQIFRAERKLQMAREELEKMKLAASGTVSVREIATAQLNVEVATSSLKELRLPQDEIMEKQIAVLKEQIAAAKKTIALHQAEAELRKIRSPLNGIIQFQSFEPGEVVKPEHVLGQVFDTTAWVVKMKLPEREITHIQLGQPVEVELAASTWTTPPLKAMISKILPVVTPQTTGDGIFYVEALIEVDAKYPLYAGMGATARIDTGKTSLLFRLTGLQ